MYPDAYSTVFTVKMLQFLFFDVVDFVDVAYFPPIDAHCLLNSSFHVHHLSKECRYNFVIRMIIHLTKTTTAAATVAACGGWAVATKKASKWNLSVSRTSSYYVHVFVLTKKLVIFSLFLFSFSRWHSISNAWHKVVDYPSQNGTFSQWF